jgi:excisionase family DNA binding protein
MRIHVGRQAKRSTYSIPGEVLSGAESPMKQRGTQFDPRKNPASARVHGSRLGMNASAMPLENPENLNVVVEPVSSPTVIDCEREGLWQDKRDGGFEPLLDVVEAAKLLRIHPKTLRVKARRGIIPGVQIGRVWRFRISALNSWLEKIAS